MLLDEIMAEIAVDSKIDNTRLDYEALKVPNIHAKWLRILSDERRIQRAIEIEIAELTKMRTLYYMGKLPDEAYREEPLHHKVLKQDLSLWLDSDKKLNDLKNKEYTQGIKVTTIEAFMKELSQRSFHIRNALEFIKFQNGG